MKLHTPTICSIQCPYREDFQFFLRCVCQITCDILQRKIRLDMQTFFHYLTYCIHRPIWSLWPIIESGTLFGLDYSMFIDSLTPGQLLSEPHTRQFQSTVAIKVSVSEPTSLYFGEKWIVRMFAAWLLPGRAVPCMLSSYEMLFILLFQTQKMVKNAIVVCNW